MLVLNDSRVVPARLRGHKDSGGRVEVLLVRREEANRWQALVRSSRPPRPGSAARFQGGLEGQWVEPLGGGRWRLRLAGNGEVEQAVAQAAELALPPYVRRPRGPLALDRERYQTVYARHPGSLAAPTAGLHFTRELLAAVAAAGVEILTVTVHIGPATFLPIRSEELEDHELEAEQCILPAETVARLVAARAERRRIVAVGTSTVRALESAAARGGLHPGPQAADLFIRPGHSFRVIDAMITNFHLPRSTPLAMLFAFAGREALLSAYATAVRSGYRFYSYGDAMLVE